MPREYLYRRCINIKYWQNYLDRNLTTREIILIKDVGIEIKENAKLGVIHNMAVKNGLYIEHLTDMDGNCLFESLKYIGIFDDADDLRKGVAFLLLLLENVDMEKEFKCKNILHTTPKIAFECTNDIKYVHCKQHNMLYQYTYQTMCNDLYGDSSWNRLNTEVVLRILAIVFNLGFRIYHTTDYISEIIPESSENPTIVNLGLMGEFHYIPLVPIPGNLDDIPECPKFRNSFKAFHYWARKMAVQTGRYIDDESDNDSGNSGNSGNDSSDSGNDGSDNNTNTDNTDNNASHHIVHSIQRLPQPTQVFQNIEVDTNFINDVVSFF